MDSLDIHPASYLKRNLSFNDTLTGPLRQRNGFAYNSSSYRRKQRMRYQRFAQRYKSVAILGTGIACVLLFALSVIRGGSAGAGSESSRAMIAETLGLFTNATEGEGTRFDRAQSPLKGLRNVVIVAGHSVLRYTDAATVEENDSWYLEPYMEIPGQAKTFVDHIRMGVEAAAADPLSILLFSGGTTKVKAGPMTEAQSYWTVAEKMDLFGMADVRHRAFTENFARDSLENLLFSICRFNELTSDYPETMTVVSYRFKEQR